MMAAMIAIPESYSEALDSLEGRKVSYGVGGIKLCPPDGLDNAQVGYSIDANGRPLVTDHPGSWSPDRIVIGNEVACGDPLFLSLVAPNPVFTAMTGEGEWKPTLVAPSIETFWKCFERFKQFAINRGSPIELERNPPSDSEIEADLNDLLRLCSEHYSAVGFWATQAEIGMDDERWQDRLERLLETGQLR
jgi:hypothetical protein